MVEYNPEVSGVARGGGGGGGGGYEPLELLKSSLSAGVRCAIIVDTEAVRSIKFSSTISFFFSREKIECIDCLV